MNPAVQKKLENLPDGPGFYLMKDAANRVIYVGKARCLRDRVRSYFAEGTSDDRAFVPLLGGLLHDIDVFITNTDKEAYLLENELIKRHRPKYNVKLRDDKNYLSLRIDLGAEFPKIERVRRPVKDGARWFGPYVSGREARVMLRTANLRFALRTCKDINFKNRSRPCMQGQMRRCLAPCVSADSVRDRYRAAVERAVLFLSGKDEELAVALRDAMKQAATRLDFEEAASIRDTLSAMDAAREKQRIFDMTLPDCDAFGFAFDGMSAASCVLSFRGGRLGAKRCQDFEDVTQSTLEVASSVILQYYTEPELVPREVLLGELPEDAAEIGQILSDLAGRPVRLSASASGTRSDLVEMAARNADHHLKLVSDRDEILEGMRRRFGLHRFPRVIECYDISHLGGTNTVAARVTFRNGAPDKSMYRHYHVRAETSGDDIAAMHEVLSRRFTPGARTDEAPDLLLVDGGRGQINAAMEVLAARGLTGKIDLLSIAKGDRKSGDSIYLPGRKNPVHPGMRSKELHMLMRLRDEAHRFGREFQQRTREKDALGG
ncbi:MAG: excinuclease ABC subunit UvrC [Myxococcota bacterium]